MNHPAPSSLHPHASTTLAPGAIARACGIDFGTSNSTVGWMRPGAAPLLALEDGKTTLPSMLFFNSEEDSISYGRVALTEYLDGYEGRLMRSLKSILGTGLMDLQTEVQGQSLSFRTILSHFIGELKHRAEQAAGRGFEHAVLGRPVHFVDDDPVADQLAQDVLADIARSVGLKHVEFQYEPIAAAFDFERTLQRETLTLIVDIGGGTSDFSLLRLSPERSLKNDRLGDILANGGVHIGGTDFDKQLSLACVMPLLGYRSRLKNNSEVPSSYYFNLATWHTINFVYTRKIWSELQDVFRDSGPDTRVLLDRLFGLISERAGHWLAMRVEETKIALSGQEHHILPLDRIAEGLTHTVARSEFEDAIDGQIVRIEDTVKGLLKDANLRADQVDTVFFTGGSSGVPLLRQRVAALLPAAQHVEGDLFGSIGSGLAIDALRKFG
ncbi:Hsp70 family protein [Amantichitinum ursilacus]|uniref:Chaperone protein HscA n=1 Tax=Amantichitinum ursilacus TaxID=857265 RepID=A0A0N1JSD9_9NEIS|nr:Hsp70 family protein [Amantichitinum ursilacus]KPC52058.1 Chaperone protein HscA [Amantichitinum ursilacus]